MDAKTFIPFLDIQPVPAMFIVTLAALIVVGIALTKIPRR